MQKPFSPGRHPIMYKKTNKKHPIDCLLRSSITAVACLATSGVTHHLVPGHSPGFPPAPSWCVENCSRPSAQESVISGIAAWTREAIGLPISPPLNCRLPQGMVLILAGRPLEVCTDRAATYGKRCGAAWYSVGLVLSILADDLTDRVWSSAFVIELLG
jgi:hypothetical protein